MAITKPSLLPELYLPSRVNQHWLKSGMDSLEWCRNREHFLSYPHKVEYHYNSRGFRDAEWPDDLSDVIWCIGDSFTVGLGSPLEHTWPYMLQQRLRRRVINVSMDGASNNWIARIAVAILTQCPQANIVVQWSYMHRREADASVILNEKFLNFYKSIQDVSWPDCKNIQDFDNLPDRIKTKIKQIHDWPSVEPSGEDRRLYHINSTTEEDIVNTRLCMQQLQGNIVHSAIPFWAPCETNLDYNVIQAEQLDYARDGHHYDILTSNALVCEIIPALASNARC
jgi:hypothetical protein